MNQGDEDNLNFYSAFVLVWHLVSFRRPQEDAPGSKGQGPGNGCAPEEGGWPMGGICEWVCANVADEI